MSTTTELIEKAGHLSLETWGNGEGLGGEVSETFDKLARHLEELDSQLADAKQATQWQPIETAPKDGRWLITFDGETVSPNYWLGSEIEHWAKTPLLATPTYWMPMPKPPEQLDLAIQAEGKA